MAKILVVGGAGYVGGTACAWLLDQGHDVWVLDDLSTGHREFVDPHSGRLMGLRGFTQARAGDRAVVLPLLERERFDCVMHFAAKALVAESVANPALYHEANVVQTRQLLDSMLAAGVKRFIFSSTCAVFGDPGVERIGEDLPKNPINPYGQSKLDVERMLEKDAREHGLEAIALRYFNAAGADPKCRTGEWHEPETHLIPRVLKAALRGDSVDIFGTDYPTPDGTAVRDYVHVWDLAFAHEAAMNRLLSGTGKGVSEGRFETYNLGSEGGYSVRQMIAAAERAIGRPIQAVEKPRRPGDPPRLVGDASRARQVLGFKPSQGALDLIFSSAWKWEQQLPSLQGDSKNRAVFLDRDGTLNVDPGYLSDPAQLELIPGVAESLASLKRAGFQLIVVSNQSGIGRGIIRPDVLTRIHARMDELLYRQGGPTLDRYEFCVHRPDEDCECRKPKAKLIHDAAAATHVDVSRSYMIGDKDSDIHAGRNAGCKASILVRTGSGAEAESRLAAGEASFIADSLAEAARWILAQETSTP